MKAIGLDLGYSAVKGYGQDVKFVIPSIVGTPEHSSFKLQGIDDHIVIVRKEEVDGKQREVHYNVGVGAIEQSRFTHRQEDRSWIKSKEYKILLLAALSACIQKGTVKQDLFVVTGLPVAFYEQDKKAVEEVFVGIHDVHRLGHDAMAVTVARCTVIPQVFGTALDVAMSEEAKIIDPVIATGHVGVIDVGGKTTNLLHSHKLGDIARETDSINLGGWDAVRAMRDPIQKLAPGVDFQDHDVQDAIIAGKLNYKGNIIDLSATIRETLDPMAEQIVSKARQLWPGEGARLEAILLSGGGANLLGARIMAMLDHGNMRVVDDPVFANVRGYYKLAVRGVGSSAE